MKHSIIPLIFITSLCLKSVAIYSNPTQDNYLSVPSNGLFYIKRPKSPVFLTKFFERQKSSTNRTPTQKRSGSWKENSGNKVNTELYRLSLDSSIPTINHSFKSVAMYSDPSEGNTLAVPPNKLFTIKRPKSPVLLTNFFERQKSPTNRTPTQKRSDSREKDSGDSEGNTLAVPSNKLFTIKLPKSPVPLKKIFGHQKSSTSSKPTLKRSKSLGETSGKKLKNKISGSSLDLTKLTTNKKSFRWSWLLRKAGSKSSLDSFSSNDSSPASSTHSSSRQRIPSDSDSQPLDISKNRKTYRWLLELTYGYLENNPNKKQVFGKGDQKRKLTPIENFHEHLDEFEQECLCQSPSLSREKRMNYRLKGRRASVSLPLAPECAHHSNQEAEKRKVSIPLLRQKCMKNLNASHCCPAKQNPALNLPGIVVS